DFRPKNCGAKPKSRDLGVQSPAQVPSSWASSRLGSLAPGGAPGSDVTRPSRGAPMGRILHSSWPNSRRLQLEPGRSSTQRCPRVRCHEAKSRHSDGEDIASTGI
ncbi:hypothetical protein Salat_1240000, partial [Sesamum alatum]